MRDDGSDGSLGALEPFADFGFSIFSGFSLPFAEDAGLASLIDGKVTEEDAAFELPASFFLSAVGAIEGS